MEDWRRNSWAEQCKRRNEGWSRQDQCLANQKARLCCYLKRQRSVEQVRENKQTKETKSRLPPSKTFCVWKVEHRLTVTPFTQIYIFTFTGDPGDQQDSITLFAIFKRVLRSLLRVLFEKKKKKRLKLKFTDYITGLNLLERQLCLK